MIVWSRLCGACILASVAVFVSCGSDGDGNNESGDAGNGGPDASGSGGSSGAGGASTGGTSTGGAGEADAAIVCGGETCTTPIGANFSQITSCCTDTDECGLNWAISTSCLLPSQPGNLDANCEGFDPPTGQSLDGCCGPSGCGAMNPFMGCVPNTVLGRAAVSCNYDPTNDCASVVAVPCDGAEDCSTGQRCCARYAGTTFVDFGCYDSCSALESDGGGEIWRELCHAGDTCENTTFVCRTSDILPDSLTRCSDMGTEAPATSNTAREINCGTETCGNREQCCLRDPYEPYCAPDTEECRCHPEAIDGGTDAAP